MSETQLPEAPPAPPVGAEEPSGAGAPPLPASWVTEAILEAPLPPAPHEDLGLQDAPDAPPACPFSGLLPSADVTE